MPDSELIEWCENIDAAAFSGDTLHSPQVREELRKYIGRWERQLEQIEQAEREAEAARTKPPIIPIATLPWRIGKSPTIIVSDRPTTHEDSGHDALDVYGGHLVAESIPPRFAAFIVEAMNKLELTVPF